LKVCFDSTVYFSSSDSSSRLVSNSLAPVGSPSLAPCDPCTHRGGSEASTAAFQLAFSVHSLQTQLNSHRTNGSLASFGYDFWSEDRFRSNFPVSRHQHCDF